jgi:transposase
MMSPEQEKAFLEPWAAEASTAGMVIVPPLHEALEKQLGRTVHPSQVYRLLARHGWRRVAPDSVYPKADAEKQEDWKKSSPKWWPPTLPARQRRENAPV